MSISGRFETVGSSGDFASIEGVYLINSQKSHKNQRTKRGPLTPVASCMVKPPFQVGNADRCVCME